MTSVAAPTRPVAKWVLRDTEFGTEIGIERAAAESTPSAERKRRMADLKRRSLELQFELCRIKHNEARLTGPRGARDFMTCAACRTLWTSWQELRTSGGRLCMQLEHAICPICVAESENTKTRAKCVHCPKGKNGVQFPKTAAQLSVERAVEEDENGNPDPRSALARWTIDGERIADDDD